jgi:hypothetical protein
LSWQFWKSGASTILAVWALTVLMPSLFYLSMQADGLDTNTAAIPELHLMYLATAVPFMVFAAIAAAGRPSHMFVLPLPSHRLLGTLMVNGAIAVGASSLLAACFVNFAFNANWPALKPTLAAVTIFCWTLAIAWPLPFNDGIRHALALVLTAVSCVGLVFSAVVDSERAETYPWSEAQWYEVLIMLVAIGVAFSCGVWNFSSSRYARDFRIVATLRWCLENAERLTRNFDRGSPPDAKGAESWREWNEKGVLLPAFVVFAGVLTCGVAATGLVSGPVIAGCLIVITYCILATSAVFGFVTGHTGDDFTVSQFRATRPMSDTQLADRILMNTVKTVATSWVLWYGFLVLAGATVWLYGKHSPKGWIGRELIWRRLGGCSIAEHYECFACGTDFS